MSSCRRSNYPTSAAFALRVKTCGFNLEKQPVVESQTCGGIHKGKVKWNERQAIGKKLTRKTTAQASLASSKTVKNKTYYKNQRLGGPLCQEKQIRHTLM